MLYSCGEPNLAVLQEQCSLSFKTYCNALNSSESLIIGYFQLLTFYMTTSVNCQLERFWNDLGDGLLSYLKEDLS